MEGGERAVSMRKATPYLLVLPAVVMLVLFKISPIIVSIVGSLYTRKTGVEYLFVGLKNYQTLFQSSAFWNSLWVTLKFNLWVVPSQILLALVLALALRTNPRFSIVFRSAFFINIGVSIATASVIWGLMMDSSNGVINSLFMALRIPPQPFLTSASQALACMIVICCWKGFSYWMLILLAGLQGIPMEIYEAARIDGASRWKMVYTISVPLIKRTIAFCLVTCTSINLMIFSPMYALTKGGPSNSTKVLMLNGYVTMFQYADRGSAYSMITILMLISFVIVGFQLKSMRSA